MGRHAYHRPRGYMEERHQSLDDDMLGDPESLPNNQPQDIVMEEQVIEIPEFATPKPESRSGVISYHRESKSLEEIVGDREIRSRDAGGKDPTTVGFRRQEQLFDVHHKHIIETEYIPQRGHTPRIDQEGMERYSNWTNDFTYGRAEPLGYQMAYFADLLWGNTQYNTAALKKGGGFNHRQMQFYTRRWNNVLRHSIGQYGKPARCDELGWVSIEEFIRNDHAWPEEDPKAWDYQNREFKPEVLKVRREILMEGYWYTLNCHPIKRRLMIAALRVPPQNVEQIQQIEGSTLYDAGRLARSGGWIRPLAICATSGHSFSGEHKRPLCVNIDYDRMNMQLTKEFAHKLAGGYHVTKVENLPSITSKGLIPGGEDGGRDHVFFGEYAPWDEVNSSTISYFDRDVKSLLVLYVPIKRLLKYRSFVTYNGDVIVMDVIPFHEVTAQEAQ